MAESKQIGAQNKQRRAQCLHSNDRGQKLQLKSCNASVCSNGNGIQHWNQQRQRNKLTKQTISVDRNYLRFVVVGDSVIPTEPLRTRQFLETVAASTCWNLTKCRACADAAVCNGRMEEQLCPIH